MCGHGFVLKVPRNCGVWPCLPEHLRAEKGLSPPALCALWCEFMRYMLPTCWVREPTVLTGVLSHLAEKHQKRTTSGLKNQCSEESGFIKTRLDLMSLSAQKTFLLMNQRLPAAL